MPARRLPRTDEERQSVLSTARAKKDDPATTDDPLRDATKTRLDTIETAFSNTMQARGTALAKQGTATELKDTAAALLTLFVSHFIQVFNLGVARNKRPNTERPYFQIAMNDDTVPELKNDDDLKKWSKNIVNGDADRVADGGIAMTDPATSEVDTARSDFLTKDADQGVKKNNYDVAQEAVKNNRPEADAVSKKIYDEVEGFYNEDEPASMRRKAREWGVMYTREAPKGTVLVAVPKASTVTTPGLEVTDDMQIRIKNTGTVPLGICRAFTENQSCDGIGPIMNPGDENTYAAANLGATDNIFLNFTNNSADTDGTAEVEVMSGG